MALTKEYVYIDRDGDVIRVGGYDEEPAESPPTWIMANGAYVQPEFAPSLALNMLGYDVDEEDRHAASLSAEDATVHIAQTPHVRNFQLRYAAVLLKAVIAYDQRAERLATAEKRRERALEALANSFARVNKPSTEWTGDDVGKLREALGRYDAELAN
jgi:hypothetical protein